MFRIFVGLSVGAVAISFASIFIKFCDDVPSIMIATYRLTISSIILLTIAKGRGIRFTSFSKKQLFMGMLGGLFLSLHFCFWISSLKFTSVASSVVLVTTNPIFVGLFSYLLFREKQPPELILGIILSFSGSIILAIGDSGLQGLSIQNPSFLLGDVLALVGAIMTSGYLMVGSRLREEMDVLSYISVVCTFSACFLLMASVSWAIPFTGYKASSYVYMALLAIVPQLIGHTAINWALKHLKTSMVAITILWEPVGASILAYIIFHETIKSFQGTGIVLIFLAIIISSRKGRKEG
ncbi:MAG: DMT family transporter [Deltaproteobacteria bacterium]|nr:DMT family transporter [Deltaproteobacteria bacterium]MBW2340234.1 DMT family transporter [Deltaproteobacteria bacterium]